MHNHKQQKHKIKGVYSMDWNKEKRVPVLIVSPERSSRDTMDLRSFRVRRRRCVRRDFLVNALQGAILNRFSSNFVCIIWLGYEAY